MQFVFIFIFSVSPKFPLPYFKYYLQTSHSLAYLICAWRIINYLEFHTYNDSVRQITCLSICMLYFRNIPCYSGGSFPPHLYEYLWISTWLSSCIWNMQWKSTGKVQSRKARHACEGGRLLKSKTSSHFLDYIGFFFHSFALLNSLTSVSASGSPLNCCLAVGSLTAGVTVECGAATPLRANS